MQFYMSSADFDVIDALNEQAIKKSKQLGGSPDDYGYRDKSKCNIFEEEDLPVVRKKWYQF